ncbi:MAG: copper resistance protein CopC, partial [Dehalococcoidia bacterium]|nr:copper resistance protein CopC [Dehalococcoidia bacterium]
RSSPAAVAELAAQPSVIDLCFSEPLEARFSTFELLSSEGESLPLDGVVVDPADEYHLSGLPRALSPGLYTVSYRNVSQSDGHEWSGSFAFTVLNPDGSIPSGQAYQPELGARNSPANILGRWFTLLGFALVAGGAALLLPLHRGGRAPALAAPHALAALHAEASRRVVLAGLVLLITGGVLVIVAQAQAVPGASVLDIAGSTRGGRLWLWRMLAVEAVAVLLALSFLARRWRAPRAEVVTLVLLPVAAAVGLLTVSLLSHAAAAPGSTWAIASDLVHLVLAALWVGGLATLGVLLWATRRQAPAERGSAMVYAVAPFATFAAVAVYGLGMTGVVRSLGELPTLPALWETEYGRWLLIKLALVTPMLGVAFLNRRAVNGLGKSPSRGALDAAAGRVRRLVPFEVLLGAAVLFSVGVLGQVPTPRGAVVVDAAASPVSVYNRVQQAGDLNVHLQVTPAVVGRNALRIHVYGAAGATIGGIDRVEVTFSRAGTLGGEQVRAAPQGQGIYTAEGSFLSLALTWQVTIDVIRPGQDDARLAFAVPIGSGTATDQARAALGSPAPQLTTRLLGALLALMAGAGLALG